MQYKYLLRAALILLLLSGSFMVISSSKNNEPQLNCPDAIQESCTSVPEKHSSGEMIWETLSRQFISGVQF